MEAKGNSFLSDIAILTLLQVNFFITIYIINGVPFMESGVSFQKDNRILYIFIFQQEDLNDFDMISDN